MADRRYDVEVRNRSLKVMRASTSLVASMLVASVLHAQGRPGAPQQLSATATGTTVSVRWSAPSAGGQPGAYLLEVGSTAGASNLAILPQGESASTTTVTAVAAGTYFIRVRAVANGTAGDPSNEVSVTVSAGGGAAAGQVTGLGQSCTTAGAIGLRDGAFMVCDAGKWRYALSADVPNSPLGAPSRPAWYPPLSAALGSKATCPTGGVRLSYSPLPVDQLSSLIPYGLMTGDHVTPIDHGYLVPKSATDPQHPDTSAPWLPVIAAASGTIVEASSLGQPTSSRVVIDHGCGVYTVYMVINRLTGVLAPYADRVSRGEYIPLSLPVEAGAEFGQQRDNPLDFNVFDQAVWQPGFGSLFAYAGEVWKPYTADPTPYYSPTVASAFDALSLRRESPKWGRIDYSTLGTAAGNWFLSETLGYSCISEADARSATAPLSIGQLPGRNTYAYCHLSLSPHWVTPSSTVASLGWYRDPAGDPTQFVIRLAAGQPGPGAMTTLDGKQVYELVQPMQDGTPGEVVLAVMAVRVNADGTLTVEVVPDARSAASFTGFSDRQRTYRR